MMLIDYMTMKNGDYHEKQIAYNMAAILNEIKKQYPEDLEPDLDNPKYADIVKGSPYAPKVMGGLAKDLGIQDRLMTLDLWRDLSNGYCPAEYLPEDSPFKKQIKDTPRGKMVVLNRNASPMDELGTYHPEEAKKQRAIGTEFVFGMGGNFSKTLARLATEDPSYIEKFNEIANRVFSEKVMPLALEYAMVRTGKDGESLNYARSIMAVNYMHIENRGSEQNGVEPYIHFHFDVLNVARGFDDKLTALYMGEVAKHKDTLNACFQAEIKEELENKMGFVFKPVILDDEKNDDFIPDDEKNICSYDLPDDWVPKMVQDFYSKRSEEMAAAQKGQGFIATEIARATSRDDKSELSPSEMMVKWRTEMDAMGWTPQSIKQKLDFNQVRLGYSTRSDEALTKGFVRKFQKTEMDKNGPVEYGAVENDPRERDQQLVKGFLRKMKELHFTEGQFKAHMVKQLINDMDKDKAQREAARIFEEQCVHMIDKTKVDYYKDFLAGKITDPHEYRQKQIRYTREMSFTTKEVLAQEQYMHETAKARSGEVQFTIPEQKAAQRLLAFENQMSRELNKPVKCSKGQRESFMSIMTKPGSAHFIMGDPGTGKSFVARAIKESYEADGKNVFAVAPTNKAVKGLANDARFQEGSYGSLAKVLNDLDKGKVKWNKDTVVIGDEMGMACLDDYHRLMKHVNESGAKIISIGDAKQIQSVAHGGTFRVMSNDFVCEQLTEINRQNTARHREMVQDFGYGRVGKGMRTLFDEGSIIICKTEEEKFQKIAQDYMEDPNAFMKKAAYAGTNADCDRINSIIRDTLKEQGLLSSDPKDEVKLQTKDGEKSFCVGDRIVFTKGQLSDDVEQEKVVNSELGTVTEFKTVFNRLTKKHQVNAIKVLIDGANGDAPKEVWLSTNKEHNVNNGYATTIHKNQGSTYEATEYAPTNLDNMHLAYVGVSRHKSGFKMYLSDELANKWAEELADKEPTKKMLKWAEDVAAKNGITLDEEMKGSFVDIRNFLNQHVPQIKGKETEPRHRMDDFASIIEAMSTTAYKKSTFDFQIMDGLAVDKYYDALKQRSEVQSNPEAHKVEVQTKDGKEYSGNEPVLIKKDEIKQTEAKAEPTIKDSKKPAKQKTKASKKKSEPTQLANKQKDSLQTIMKDQAKKTEKRKKKEKDDIIR
ncbi:AAA family ATPase [Burkholderia cenocepacia]|uniref:AAA family ATPase n=1 Tax=Burkholderia cenocepacia TaxID=95486 RepID=UPI00084739CB|nr:AAA family ATPase [Burkholderia cenocepacia]